MNYRKANHDEPQHFLTSKCETTIKIDCTDIKSSFSKKLLGVLIDNKLTIDEHVCKLCKKASNKLHPLAWTSKYMAKDKLKTVFFSFSVCILPLSLDLP